MFVDALPWWERCTYWVVGVTGIAYSIYILFLEGEMAKNNLLHAALSPGWSWLSRSQDQSDIEWWVWRRAWYKIFILNIIHVLLSQICFYFKVNEKIHYRVLLIYDVAAACTVLGIRVVVLQFILALAMYATTLLQSIPVVWLMEVAMISSLNYNALYDFQAKYLKFLNYDEECQFYVTLAFFYIHLLSFAIEKITYRKSQAIQTNVKTEIYEIGHCEQIETSQIDSTVEIRDKSWPDTCLHRMACHGSCEHSCTCTGTQLEILDYDPSFMDLLFYSFYLPTLFDGPIVIYRDFHTQIKASFNSSTFRPDVYDIVKQMIRLAFWAFFIDFQFHFLYYSAFSLHPKVIARLPVWAVAAIGYCQGQFFMIKYVVLYGLPIQLSRFDGFIPLAVPRCISWVYSFTDMWKYFDVGLYNFIKTYIYIPLGGSRAGLFRQIFASGLVFLFIYFWHGAREEMFIWCFGNFLMGLLEIIALLLEQSAVGIRLKSYLGPAMYLRVKATLIFPVYLSSCLQVLYFFFQREAGWIFVSKLVTKASWTTLLTELIIFTSCIHNAIYIAQRYKYREKESTNEEHKFKKEKCEN